MIQRLVQRYTQASDKQSEDTAADGALHTQASSHKERKKIKTLKMYWWRIPPASALITKAMSVGAVPIALFHSPLGAEKGYPDILN